jgi:hypothetical protein
MQSLLTLEVLRSEHPGDGPPTTWRADHPPAPPQPRRRLRGGVARRRAGLAAGLAGERARSALAR